MSKFTVEKALEIIDNICVYNNDTNYFNTKNKYGEIDYSIAYMQGMSGSDNNYEFKVVQSEGGDEGDGERMHLVFEIKNSKTNEVFYFRIDGRYDSWNDSYFRADTLKIVEPKQITVTIYE